MTAEKRTRTRSAKPEWRWSGLDLTKWQSDPQRIHWARTDRHFADALTVLVNEQPRQSPLASSALTENARHGFTLGWDACMAALRALSDAPDRARPQVDIDYTGPSDPVAQVASPARDDFDEVS